MAEESLKSKLDEFVKNSSELGETALKLARLNTIQKTANISSNIIFTVSVSVLLLFAVLFGSIATAWWIGDLLYSRVAGFLVIGGVYLLLFLIFLLLKNKIILPWFRNKIVSKIYE